MTHFYSEDGISNRTSYFNAKHGMYRTKLYAVWNAMRQRCRALSERNYGERGITVCDEWDKSFIPFMEWALKNGYKEGLDIDRRDNSEGYFPWNCRFVGRSMNSRNTRARGKTSKYRGVAFRKDTGKWDVRTKINLKQHCLGNYGTEKEALTAYNECMSRNFPNNPELIQPWLGPSQADPGDLNKACKN